MFESDYERPSFTTGLQQQQQPSQIMPDHLKCGEVYTWLCAGELYAVECTLCEDHPLCPLSEFPEHMEIWHTDWEEMNAETNSNSFKGKEEFQIVISDDLNNLNNGHALSINTVESGLFETDAELHNVRSVTSHEEQEEVPQPFEQVLIEQDLTIDTTTSTSEDVNESEYFQDVNEQVAAETGLLQIENKHQQKLTFVKQTLTMANKVPTVTSLNELITVGENESQNLTVSKESKRNINFNPAKSCRIKQKYLNTKTQSKRGRFERKLTNFKINNKIESETSGSETTHEYYAKAKKYLKNSKSKTKRKQQKSVKLKEIKKALNRIIEDISDLNGTYETESEASVKQNCENIFDSNNLKTQTSMQKSNLCRKTKAETNINQSSTNGNGTNMLNTQIESKISIKNAHNKKKTSNTLLKINRNNFKKFKTKKRVFRKIIKNKIRNENETETEQKLNSFKTSLEMSLEDKTAERIENETQITENIEKLSETVKENHENETKNRRQTKHNYKVALKENETNLIKSKIGLRIISKYINVKNYELMENEIVTNKNKTKISENDLENHQNMRKINKYDMERNGCEAEQNGYEAEQNVNETEQNGNETQLYGMASEDKTKSNTVQDIQYLPKQAKRAKLKQNDNKIGTMENETNEKNNYFCDNLNETSKNETYFTSNIQKCTEKSLNSKVNTGRYPTRKRTRNSKGNEIATSGNETLLNENEAEQNVCIKEKDEGENFGDKNKSQLVINNNGTNGNETNNSKCLTASIQIRTDGKKFSKKILSQKSKENQAGTNENERVKNKNKTELYLDNEKEIKSKLHQNAIDTRHRSNAQGTHENETNIKNICQLRRTSSRIKKNLENLIQGNNKSSLTNAEGTLGYETLEIEKSRYGNESDRRSNESETLLKPNPSKVCAFVGTKITDEIKHINHFEDEKLAGINEEKTSLNQEKVKSELWKNCVNERNVKKSLRKSLKIEKKVERKINTRQQVNENEKSINESGNKQNLSENTNELETNPHENLKSTNGLETQSYESFKDMIGSTILLNQSERKSYEDLKQTDGNETVSNNARRSLRNIRKNSKYFENLLQLDKDTMTTEGTNGFVIKHPKQQEGRHRAQCRNIDKKEGTKQQKTLVENKHFKVKDTKMYEGEQEPQIADFKNSEGILVHEAIIKPPKSIAKRGKRNRLRVMRKVRRKELKRKLRNCSYSSSFKQKLSSDHKKRENLISNKKKTNQQSLEHVLRSHKRYRRKLLCLANKRKDFTTDFLLRPSIELRESEGSSLTGEAGKKKHEEENCPYPLVFAKEISTKCAMKKTCVENRAQAKNNGVENILKEAEIIKNSKEINTLPEENNSDIIAIGREKSIPAKDNGNESVLKQQDSRENSGLSIILPKELDTEKIFSPINVEANGEEKDTPAKENDDKQVQNCYEIPEENLAENRYLESSDITEQFADISSNPSPLNSFPKDNALAEMIQPLSPLSPKTEEEHFEFYEPKQKLNRQQISHLIKLYQEHSRLWDQTHPDYCEPQLCRKSWQQITKEWNKYCRREFSIAEVRIRICTLCQRFVQEKDRLALEGELDECAKFSYYEEMKFLEHQKSLRKRRELYEQQNEKILEIYQHFPILWHVRHYKSRQAKKRAEAFESISKVLKLFGLHLSSLGVQKRIRSLRKFYRLEKIRYLHAQVEQTPFDWEFRHYDRMQFLHKHIDPFVCRVCGKIFENLQGFREHLEGESHGSFFQEEDIDTENIFEPDELENAANAELFDLDEDQEKPLKFSSVGSQMESFTESENSTDIIQRFSPISASPVPCIENDLNHLENNSKCFPLITPNESLINSLHLEDQLIEEIIGNVSNSDCFSQQGLDLFINSVTICKELTNGNKLFEEVLSPSLLHTANHFAEEHTDVINDQTSSIFGPLANAESLVSVSLGSENTTISEHADINETDYNFRVPLPSEEIDVMEIASATAKELQPIVVTNSPVKVLENQVTVEHAADRPTSSNGLVVKVQCADYSVNLNLNKHPQDFDHECYSSADNSIAPLPDLLIHKMIELYRKFSQLWDPNHLDFNSRTLRRQAWVNLTMEFNSIVGKQLSWRTLHRKLTDYAKYYKKLVTEQENYENLANKWIFYEDFKFLDDVIAVNTELQRSVHHRDNNFKIIRTYKSFPQLWNIKHPDFSKRNCKQRNIELMCNKLQEENNLQLTTERLKNRIIELRAQYRAAKKQRLKCLKNHHQFSSSEFEFYEALSFLDDHIDPFKCDKCKMEFRKLTDYNQHLKKEHSTKKRFNLPPTETGMENVCHICGTKFTTRSNLVHHIKRHEGIRNYACSMCPKKFYASHALKVHIRSHTKECPYTCEKCGLSFVSASKLNQHVKRHLNQKDFECSHCPKAFFTAFEKDRHERRHLNIRDKVCTICGKTFVAGSSYYAHLMLHNDTKRFECDQCDMKFAQYPGLFKHKKRHHK